MRAREAAERNTIGSMRAESWVALGLAAAVFAASFAIERRWRRGVTLGAMAVLLLDMWRLPLRLPFAEGDYSNFVQDRGHFANYMGGEGIQFQYHLSSQVVRGIDALYGQTNASMGESFHWLSRLIALVLMLGLAGLCRFEDWSPRVVRYAALALAVPTIDLFFGYHEFGLLPAGIEAWAIPLALIAVDRERWGLFLAAMFALGLACALHGFGLFALVFVLLAALVRHPSREGAGRAALGLAVAVAGWAGPVPFYLTVLNDAIAPGHADELPLRPLLHPQVYTSYNDRVAAPVIHSLGTIGLEFLIVGALSLFLLPLVRDRLRLPIAVAAIPVVLGVIFFWPVQGLAGDTDYLASAFPAVYATSWLLSQRLRAAAAVFAILFVGHVAFAHALTLAYFHG